MTDHPLPHRFERKTFTADTCSSCGSPKADIQHIVERPEIPDQLDPYSYLCWKLSYLCLDSDGNEWEHVPNCAGEATCPRCWALDIRRAVAGTQGAAS